MAGCNRLCCFDLFFYFLIKLQLIFFHTLTIHSLIGCVGGIAIAFVSNMKIAIATWHNQVSNVFDFAGIILLVESEQGEEIDRQTIDLYGRSGIEKAALLRQMGVDILICGAISKAAAVWLNGSGIQVAAFVTGSTEQVLAAYLGGTLDQPQFVLPGCGGGRHGCPVRQRGRHGRRWQQSVNPTQFNDRKG